jgi:hypothetical protein
MRRIRPRNLGLHGIHGRWPLRSGHLRMVGLRKVRLLRLRDIRIGSGLVYWAMEDILQLVPLPGIDGRQRIGIHGGANEKL